MTLHRRSLRSLTLLLAGMSQGTHADDPGLVERLVRDFENSDIEFQRSASNAPFPPLGFLGASRCSDVSVETPAGLDLTYDVDRYSAMAAVPVLLGSRDAVLGGIYLSQSEFDVAGNAIDDFKVTSVGLPLGWLRQTGDDWQVAAFVMPLGHESDQDKGDWEWQYLGGAFARYIQNDRLWWAFGAYMDVGSDDNFYIPYLGASWAISQTWTLSAIMPWPAIIYAPSDRWMIRLGAAPSGHSWSLATDSSQISVNIDAWDFGLGTEYRISGNVWLGAEAGIGGLRGLYFTNDSVEEPDLDFSSNSYFTVSLKYRPSLEGSTK